MGKVALGFASRKSTFPMGIIVRILQSEREFKAGFFSSNGQVKNRGTYYPTIVSN